MTPADEWLRRTTRYLRSGRAELTARQVRRAVKKLRRDRKRADINGGAS